VVGTGGFVAFSEDGQRWRDVHRYTTDELVGVVASDAGVIAVGRKGAFVRYARDGSEALGGMLPDKFKPAGIAVVNGAVVAFAGKKAYGTGDGASWARLESVPYLPTGKSWLTRAGICSIAKVGKNAGVTCSVEGMAHGLAPDVAAVVDGSMISLTRDGGSTWVVAAAPFGGVQAVFGPAAGPWYAVGSGGDVALTKDGGRSWVDQQWEETATLRSGLVDGSTILMVGDGSTLVYSKDGGTSWGYAEPPVGGSFAHVTKMDGVYVASTGSTVITSADGVTWTEDAARVVEVPAGGDCSALPPPGARCQFSGGTTTPEGLPNVRSLGFQGDSGIATGDAGLVAFTSDGGASWTTSSGLDLGWVVALDARGDTVAATNGKRIVVSDDRGATFRDASVPAKVAPAVLEVALDGTIYAAGRGGTLLEAVGDHSAFVPVETTAPIKATLSGLFEVNGFVYAAGTKGELWRGTADLPWSRIELGLGLPILAMTGEGDTVMAVTAYGRKTSHFLLRSDDGGLHFYVVGQMSSSGHPSDFRLEGGRLRHRDRVSDDLGRTWRPAVDWYVGGGVDLADGSGKRIVNLGAYYGEDTLMIVGDEREDWVVLDGPYNKGARFVCDAASGCWMLAGGTVYRPVG
jgi:photosystem II stability/assembly factor-like uncharacterized protein